MTVKRNVASNQYTKWTLLIMIKDLVPFYQWKSVGEGSNFISDKRHFTPQVAISYPHMSALGHMFIIYYILIISK